MRAGWLVDGVGQSACQSNLSVSDRIRVERWRTSTQRSASRRPHPLRRLAAVL